LRVPTGACRVVSWREQIALREDEEHRQCTGLRAAAAKFLETTQEAVERVEFDIEPGRLRPALGIGRFPGTDKEKKSIGLLDNMGDGKSVRLGDRQLQFPQAYPPVSMLLTRLDKRGEQCRLARSFRTQEHDA